MTYSRNKRDAVIRLLHYSANFYVIILTVLALLLPSYARSIFSGIPLNTRIEFFIFIFLISFLLGLILTKRLNFMLDKKILLFSLPIVLVIFIKILCFNQIVDRPDGFEARYRSILNELPEGQSEFSFDYFLKSRKNFTRYDEIIDFDSDWKLGFWNELRFNEYQWIDGKQIRERNPFEVEWRGNILIPNDPELKLSIEYTGEGEFQLGNSTVSLPTEYLSKNIFLVDINEFLSENLTEQENRLVLPLIINYRFQDFSKVGVDKNTLGPNSNISVKWITKKETSFVRSFSAENFIGRGFSFLFDSIIFTFILIIIISHFFLLYKESRILFIAYLFIGAIFLFLSLFQTLDFINSANFHLKAPRIRVFLSVVVPSSIFFFAVVFVRYFSRRQKKILFFFISFIFITQLFIHINADLGEVFYRDPGDDSMTYESQSRSIGKAENIYEFLRGDSDVFHYQPFFRYYLASNHILFGDGTNGLSIFHRFLFLFTIPFIFLFFSQRLKFIPALFFSLAIMWIFYNWIFFFIDIGLSEYPAWLFLILAVYLLFFNRSHLGFFIGFVLLGFACITRINFLLGILFLIFIFFISYLFNRNGHKLQKKKYGFIFMCFLIFVGIYSLVPLHNYYFGKKLILTNTSSNMNVNLTLQPSKLLQIFSDEKVKQQVLSKLKLMFYFDWNRFSHEYFYFQLYRFLFGFFIYFFLFLLIVSFLFNIFRLIKTIIVPTRAVLIKNESIYNLFLILIPISFLFVHLFYVIKTYYPRHIVIGHIMIYLFSIYCSSSLINQCYEKVKNALFSSWKVLRKA